MKFKLVKSMASMPRHGIIGKKHDYIMESARVSGGGLLTENINSCVAGVVGNGKYNLMFHLAPEQQSLDTLDKIFSRKMQELISVTKDEPLDAIICGGLHSSTADRKSIALYNRVAELLEDWGARLSIICGKKPNHLDNLFIKENRLCVMSDDWEKLGLTPEKLKKMSADDITEILEKKYETVEIHPEHVFIG